MFDIPVFDNGNAFNPEKGEFVAPVTGLYSIVTTVCVKPNTYIVVGVIKYGAFISRFLTGDDAYDTCNSESKCTKLFQDDRVG